MTHLFSIISSVYCLFFFYLANFSVTPYTVLPSMDPVNVLKGILEPERIKNDIRKSFSSGYNEMADK